MKSIKATFESRNQWVNNRASAVFPCYLNKNNEQVLSFQNYWLWKANIADTEIYITLINTKSSTKIRKKINLTTHNEIFIKKIFKITDFQGLINFEVFSKKNLRFAFPAVYCFYLNKTGLISCVHSSGRILNKNEKSDNFKFNETNFLCKLNKDFEPFFHIFKGPEANKNKKLIELEVKDKNNKKILKTKKYVDLKKPYASKIFFLKDFLNEKNLKKLLNKEFFIIIKYSEKKIYGRLVAGNYDKKNDALFTTHTLNPPQNKSLKDFIKPNKNNNSNTFLCLMSDKKLNLETRIYPTNQNFNTNFFIKKTNKINAPVKKIKQIDKISSGIKGKIFKKSIKEKNLTLLYTNKKVPGRIYVSHNYFYKDCRHPTDMGLAFNNINMPEKKVHWGQLFARKGYQSVLFVRNISHAKSTTKKNSKCILQLFNNNYSKKINFKVNQNSFKILNLKNFSNKIKTEFISWKLFAKDGNTEVIWLSLNKKKGSICGDHSF